MAESTADSLGKILPIAVMGGIVGGVSSRLMRRERKDVPISDKIVHVVVDITNEDKVTELAKKHGGINSDIAKINKTKLQMEYTFSKSRSANAFRKAFQQVN